MLQCRLAQILLISDHVTAILFGTCAASLVDRARDLSRERLVLEELFQINVTMACLFVDGAEPTRGCGSVCPWGSH